MECQNLNIASVNVADCRFSLLNEKINAMLGNHILYDTDVRDLWSIMQQLGIRDQWKEMNAKIRAELEGISKHVDEATKILDANPPEFKYELQPRAAYGWANYGYNYGPNFNFSGLNLVPAHERYTPVEHKQVRFALEKPELVSLPWAEWNCQVNTQVAKANVSDIIPAKRQVVQRRLFGEWDALLEDVVEWHKFGLHRFNVRMFHNAPGYAYGPRYICNIKKQ